MSKASLQNLKCAVCESEYRVEMHHIRMMKDLNPKLNKIDALTARLAIRHYVRRGDFYF